MWNGLTDEFHPTQILADILTMREHSGKPLVRGLQAVVAHTRQCLYCAVGIVLK